MTEKAQRRQSIFSVAILIIGAACLLSFCFNHASKIDKLLFGPLEIDDPGIPLEHQTAINGRVQCKDGYEIWPVENGYICRDAKKRIFKVKL